MLIDYGLTSWFVCFFLFAISKWLCLVFQRRRASGRLMRCVGVNGVNSAFFRLYNL